MRIPRSVAMTLLDVACLKWSSILFGMIFGAHYPKFIKRNLWFFVIAVILLAIKPGVSFCRGLHCRPEECEEAHEQILA
ncbi:MAG: hypothetical protein ACYC9O_20925 [Candidatus Latescibacterota bacterium]